MTYSLLMRDPDTGVLGAAAATGNLCVGAWVLRGRAGVGLSASQGHSPSTPWGSRALDLMARGLDAAEAVSQTVRPDAGRAARQLLALDTAGRCGAFTGAQNLPECAEVLRQDLGAAGNMLTDSRVIAACAEAALAHQGRFLRKLIAGLQAGARAGGDARGLMSAAVLVLAEDHPPVDLRVDFAPDPIRALVALADRVEAPDYAAWMKQLPVAGGGQHS